MFKHTHTHTCVREYMYACIFAHARHQPRMLLDHKQMLSLAHNTLHHLFTQFTRKENLHRCTNACTHVCGVNMRMHLAYNGRAASDGVFDYSQRSRRKTAGIFVVINDANHSWGKPLCICLYVCLWHACALSIHMNCCMCARDLRLYTRLCSVLDKIWTCTFLWSDSVVIHVNASVNIRTYAIVSTATKARQPPEFATNVSADHIHFLFHLFFFT